MSTNKPSKEEILQTLPNFYGTENYHRWSAMFPNFVLTDGAKYIAEFCGAYWLMDAIASHRARYAHETFLAVTLKRVRSNWVLYITDGDENTLARQFIEFSDFPLDEIKLFIVTQEDLWVIMLPSEY